MRWILSGEQREGKPKVKWKIDIEKKSWQISSFSNTGITKGI